MHGSGVLDAETAAYVETVAGPLREVLGEDLIGVYLHGSGVLGDFAPERSDVDVLAVSSRGLSTEDKRRIAEDLTESALPCPAAGLELHVIASGVLQGPSGAPRFELHVVTDKSKGTERVLDGRGRAGDPDLLMHFAVIREHGRAVAGPGPSEVFPRIPRAWLVGALVGELRWAEQHASPAYQVLNACRAWRYLEDDLLCSKLEGATWAAERAADRSVVETAIRRRQGLTRRGPSREGAKSFLREVLRHLEEARV
jgi:hypothetical protein